MPLRLDAVKIVEKKQEKVWHGFRCGARSVAVAGRKAGVGFRAIPRICERRSTGGNQQDMGRDGIRAVAARSRFYVFRQSGSAVVRLQHTIAGVYAAALFALCSACSDGVRLEPDQLNLYGSAARACSFEDVDAFAKTSPMNQVVELVEDSTLPGAITPPLVLAEGNVCIGTNDGAVACLMEDVLVWKTALAGNAVPAAALCGDNSENVYAIGNDGAVTSFDAKGRQRWRLAAFRSGPVITYSDLLAVQDGIVAASSAGDIAKISFDGKVVWRWTSVLSPTKTFAADDGGNLYIALTHNEFEGTDSLLVLSPQGKQVWALAFEGTRLIKTPVITGNAVVITGVRQAENIRVSVLHKIDRMGRILWSKEVTITPRGVSIARDGTIYVAGFRAGLDDPRSAVIALSPQGTELWKKNYEFAIPSPVLISDEVLAFMGTKGMSTGLYLIMRDGSYIDVVSLGAMPVVNLQPAVDAQGIIVLASVESLGTVLVGATGIRDILPF